jgi:hypothetical protein
MIRLVALVLAASLAAPAFASSEIGADDVEVTAEADISLVREIDDAIEAASGTIGACNEAGGELTDCLCAHLDDLARVRSALDAALDAHPEWEGRSVFVRDVGGGRSLTIWLGAVAQSAVPPDCN